MKSGDLAAVKAARLAGAVGQPVCVQWTREEEFTSAYFIPVALIEIRAGLDRNGQAVAWDFTNINRACRKKHYLCHSPRQMPRAGVPLPPPAELVWRTGHHGQHFRASVSWISWR